MSTEVTKRLFTVRDYHRMVEAGILRENDRVELIYGEVLAMSPIGPPHNAAVARATHALVKVVGDQAIVRIQTSVELDQHSEPQPDIVLVRPRDDYYSTENPHPNDILLIVEISDSSLKYDQDFKSRLYAEMGIQEYWIADVQHDRVFVYSDLHDASYRIVRQFQRGQFIAPGLLADCRIQIDSLLP